jgi:hypothetical protein
MRKHLKSSTSHNHDRSNETRVGRSVVPLSTTPADDAVMSAEQTANLLGVSKFTLLRMRQRPDADGLPFVKLSPNRIGYVRRDVLAFIAARRVGNVLKAA